MYIVGPLIHNKWEERICSKFLNTIYLVSGIYKSAGVQSLTCCTVQVNYLIFCKSIFLVCQLPRFLASSSINCWVDWRRRRLVQLIVIKHCVIIINDVMTFIMSPVMTVFTITVMKLCDPVADLKYWYSQVKVSTLFTSLDCARASQQCCFCEEQSCPWLWHGPNTSSLIMTVVRLR